MRYSVLVPALMAASSMAAPAVNMVYETVRVTRTVTAGQDIPAATPAPAAQVITYAVNAPPAPSPAPEAPAPVAPAPSVPQTPDADVGSDDISDEAVLNIVNQWRSRFGLGQMRWSQKLADNAYEVGRAGNGVNQTHTLPPIDGAGKCGQVITPGADRQMDGFNGRNPFDMAYATWLCEVPTEQTRDYCPDIRDMGMGYKNTAHYEELVDPEYTQVGCAFYPSIEWNGSPAAHFNGLWTCSLESE